MILKFLTAQNNLTKPNTDEKDQSKQNKNIESEYKDNNIIKEVLNTDIKHTQSDITKNQEVTEVVEYPSTLAQLISSETKDSKLLLNLETNITKNNIVTDLEKDTVIDCTVTPGSEDIPNETTNLGQDYYLVEK